MVSTCLRVKNSAPAEKATEMSHVSTQTEPVRKETSAEAVGCNVCPDPISGEKVSACTRCAQVDDLIRQVAELHKTI